MNKKVKHPMSKYKIVLQDGVELYIEKEVIKNSPILAELFKDQFTDQYKPFIVIPNLDIKIFAHIVSFIRHLVISVKDAEEFGARLVENMDYNTLIDIIHTAHFLEVELLVKISSYRLTYIIENNDVNNIRKILNINNDFTSEEELALEQDLAWSQYL
jgi:hypothetical protein